MTSYKTSGLVLHRLNLGEADRIITIITPEMGVTRAVAKGVRKAGAKLAGHLELFNVCELMLVKGKNLDIVAGARLIKHFPTLVDEYESLSLAYLMARMVTKLADGPAIPRVYELVLDVLDRLNEGYRPVLELYFKLRLLDILGWKPNITTCANCHTPLKENRYYFNNQLGGLEEESCAKNKENVLSKESLISWRAGMDGRIDDMITSDGLDICDRFYGHIFNTEFRSLV